MSFRSLPKRMPYFSGGCDRAAAIPVRPAGEIFRGEADEFTLYPSHLTV